MSRAGRWETMLLGRPENLEALLREGWEADDAPGLFAALCAALGFERATARLEGDLNAAAWDGEALWLRRGRPGREPLVWRETPRGLRFSSRPRALAGDLPLQDEAIFVERGPFLPPETPWRGLRALAPGEGLRVDARGLTPLPSRAVLPPAGRAGKPAIWAKALENALALACARTGPSVSLLGTDTLPEAALGLLLRRADSTPPAPPAPDALLARSAVLDAPLPEPALLADAARAARAGAPVLLSAVGADEVLGGVLPPRRRLRGLLGDGGAPAALMRARQELAERRLSPLWRLIEAEGRRLETPYATALVLGVAELIPAEHLRDHGLLALAFAGRLPRPAPPREVPPPADAAWRRRAWRAWVEGLSG